MELALPLARTGEAAKSGPLGLAVVLVLAVACYFLFRSMSKHMRKVPEDFSYDSDVPESPPEPEDDPVATPRTALSTEDDAPPEE